MQGSSFLALLSQGIQPSVSTEIWIEWKTDRGKFQTQMIRPFFSLFLLFLPKLPMWYTFQTWRHVSPNIHCFCTAGARAIFWFLLITDQWNYVKHVSCARVFLPAGLISCRFVCCKNMAWDRKAAPLCWGTASEMSTFCFISVVLIISVSTTCFGGKNVSEGFKFVFWTTAGVGWGSPHFEVIVIDV